MAHSVKCYGGAISNPEGDGPGYPCFFYDRDGAVVCHLMPNEIKVVQSFIAVRLSIHLHGSARAYTFPRDISLNPGDTLVLSLDGAQKKATVYVGATRSDIMILNREASLNALADHAVLTATGDQYLSKVLALAKVHALLGSTRSQFNDALLKSKIRDTADMKKLTKDQFDMVNKANATVRLQGDKTTDEDQTVYDETAMLACFVNTRLNAMTNAQHPEMYDISKQDAQIQVENASANALFNYYYAHMGSFVTSTSMSSETVAHTYNSVEVQLEAIKDIFQSLALPESAFKELLGAVSSFVESEKTISASVSDKTLMNAKLVNFYSVQPPLGNPELNHVAKMRMIYVQFNESTYTWTSNCASGVSYKLNVDVFTLDVELNRQVVHLVYDHAKQKILEAAETDLDSIGDSGSKATVPPVKVPGPNPIGPPTHG